MPESVTRRRALYTVGGAVLGLSGVAVLAACGATPGQSATTASPTQTATASRAQAATTATASTASITTASASSAASTASMSAATSVTRTAGALDWIVWGSTDQTKTFNSILNNFAKSTPGLKVQLEVVPFGNFFDKLQTEVAGAAPPDVAMASPIWVPNFVVEKLYQPLDSFMARDHFDSGSYFPAALQAFAIDGKQYGLPHLLNPSITFYNKDLFSQAGVKLPDPAWTWDTYRQAAQTLTQQAGGKTTRFGTNQVNSLNPLLPFIWMNGGDIFDSDEHPTKSTASNPATVDAIQWMADLLTKDHAAPGPDDLKGQTDPFGAGLLAMQLGGAASILTLEQSASHVRWDVAHIPQGKDGLIDFLGAPATASWGPRRTPTPPGSLSAISAVRTA